MLSFMILSTKEYSTQYLALQARLLLVLSVCCPVADTWCVEGPVVNRTASTHCLEISVGIMGALEEKDSSCMR